MRDLSAREIDLTAEIGRKARETAIRYGQATGHAADLNIGDCLAYASAKVLGRRCSSRATNFRLPM